MAVGQKRNPRAAGTKVPAARTRDAPAALPVLDDLLPRVARGDTEAFGAVCDQVSGAVYGLVRRIISDQSRAEQVAGAVLLEVWRSASRFSPAEGSGLEWIMTMARRRAVSRAAVDNARAAGLVPARTSGVAKDPGVAKDQAVRSLPAHRGLASLPEPQREAVLLASSGYTWRQVAELQGVPAGTAAERLRDGLLSLGGPPEQRPSSMASSAEAAKARETEN
jgi:RNA polymerase sigma-70 factor (ECF subfamily)